MRSRMDPPECMRDSAGQGTVAVSLIICAKIQLLDWITQSLLLLMLRVSIVVIA